MRELQRVPHPFRSAHDRGEENEFLPHPLAWCVDRGAGGSGIKTPPAYSAVPPGTVHRLSTASHARAAAAPASSGSSSYVVPICLEPPFEVCAERLSSAR